MSESRANAYVADLLALGLMRSPMAETSCTGVVDLGDDIERCTCGGRVYLRHNTPGYAYPDPFQPPEPRKVLAVCVRSEQVVREVVIA